MVIHSIADLHNDILTAKPRRAAQIEREALAVCAVWTTRLKNPWRFLEKARCRVRFLAVEDLGFVTRHTLPLLADFKPVYASLTWNHENALAGGAHCDAGLTALGARAIDFLESKNILFDVAHLNERSFFDAMSHVKKPVICSHACFNGVFKHPRNLSYGQIKVITEGGGLVGLTLVPEFMGRKCAGGEDVIRQIDYFCARFDYKRLAVGTDFYGCKKPAIVDYHGLTQLKYELVRRGYTVEQVEAIFYGNAAEFLGLSNTVVSG